MIEANLGAIVSIGRLSIPLWALVLMAGYGSGALALRISLRAHPEVRREIADRVSTAVLIAILVWKLAPVVVNPGLVIERPLYLLYATGGTLAAVIGSVGALGYLALSTRRWWSGEDAMIRIRGIAVFAAVAIAIAAFGVLIASVTGVGAAVPVQVTEEGEAGSSAGEPVTPVNGTDDARADDAADDRDDRDDRPMAPDFVLHDLDGVEHTLFEYRGKMVVLNFWASWCPPCRAELPVLADYAREVDPDDVVVLSINQTASESSFDALASFVEREGIQYPVLLDGSNRAFLAYGVRGIPVTYIVDSDGRISARRTGVVTPSWLRRND